MKYHLTLKILEGQDQGKWMNIDFEADTDRKAVQFAREIVNLKTQDGRPCNYGPYLVQRRIFPLIWRILECTIIDASYKRVDFKE